MREANNPKAFKLKVTLVVVVVVVVVHSRNDGKIITLSQPLQGTADVIHSPKQTELCDQSRDTICNGVVANATQ